MHGLHSRHADYAPLIPVALPRLPPPSGSAFSSSQIVGTSSVAAGHEVASTCQTLQAAVTIHPRSGDLASMSDAAWVVVNRVVRGLNLSSYP
jgi:hypothetical protein